MSDYNNYEPPERAFPHTFFAFVSTIGIIVLFILSGSLIIISLNAMENYETMTMVQALSQLVFLLIPTLAVMNASPLGMRVLTRVDRPRITTLHYLSIGAFVILIQAFATGWDVVQSAILPEFITEWMKSNYETTRKMSDFVFGTEGQFALLRALTVGVIFPAVSEEILFRGLMQRSIEESSGVAVAITHTAIMFAVLHFNPAQVLPLIFIGIVLGRLATSSGSLIPSIILHLCNNALVLISYRIPSLHALEDVAPSLTVGIVLTVLSVSGIILVLMRLPRPELRQIN